MAADLYELTLPAGADPALSYPRPDVEWLIWQTVAPLGGVVSWAYTGVDGPLPGWVTTTNVQIDVRAPRRALASARADAVRRVVCALPWVDWPDGVVSRVQVVELPFWLPDELNAPRYVARYAVQAHPRSTGLTERTAP